MSESRLMSLHHSQSRVGPLRLLGQSFHCSVPERHQVRSGFGIGGEAVAGQNELCLVELVGL